MDRKFEKNDTIKLENALAYLHNETDHKTLVRYVIEDIIIGTYFKLSTIDRKYIRLRLALLMDLARFRGYVTKVPNTALLLFETPSTVIDQDTTPRSRNDYNILRKKSNKHKKERKVKLKKHGNNIVIERRADEFNTEIHSENDEVNEEGINNHNGERKYKINGEETYNVNYGGKNDVNEDNEISSSSSLESKKQEIMENFSKIKEHLKTEAFTSIMSNEAKIKLQQIEDHWQRIRAQIQDYVRILEE